MTGDVHAARAAAHSAKLKALAEGASRDEAIRAAMAAWDEVMQGEGDGDTDAAILPRAVANPGGACNDFRCAAHSPSRGRRRWPAGGAVLSE
jgi:hypothetical protein